MNQPVRAALPRRRTERQLSPTRFMERSLGLVKKL